jgi:hypothetical protein
MELVKKETELQISITKTDFAGFIDEVQRWNNITLDDITKTEFALYLKGFSKLDFDYCLKTLREDLQKKYIISPSDLYGICLTSKLKREKTERLNDEINSKNLLSENVAGKKKIGKAFEHFEEKLSNSKKEFNDGFKKKGFHLYDYSTIDGKLEKIMADGDIPDSVFLKAIKDSNFPKPFKIKRIYYKTLIKEQLDKSGNSFSCYNSFSAVSSNMEGSKIQTVGYY